MNLSLAIPEILVVISGVALLLADLWLEPARRRMASLSAVLVLGLVFLSLLLLPPPEARTAFADLFVADRLAGLFKQIFLLAAMGVLILASHTERGGTLEMHALLILALSGMMFAASANHFAMVFVSLELTAITFYILTGFHRHRLSSLEAGTKYLILGAISTGFLIYGIALVYGATGSMSFADIAAAERSILLETGLLLVLGGIGFKIAAVPWQIWVPDVYQGAPTPITAFLAIGSKAAGFVVLLRILGEAAPELTRNWRFWMVLLSIATILHGNLCALPQRNLKRLLAYSGIAHAGYLLMGIAAASAAGAGAIAFSLYVYLFAALAAFVVLILAGERNGDISCLAGLGRRSPFLALSLTLALASLAGIPPLAGFLGKFLLLTAVVEQAASSPLLYLLVAVAIIGVGISLAYYFNLVRIMYWPREIPDTSPVRTPLALRVLLVLCLAGMFVPCLPPGTLVHAARQAAQTLF